MVLLLKNLIESLAMDAMCHVWLKLAQWSGEEEENKMCKDYNDDDDQWIVIRKAFGSSELKSQRLQSCWNSTKDEVLPI